jgi:hypothetical protein
VLYDSGTARIEERNCCAAFPKSCH